MAKGLQHPPPAPGCQIPAGSAAEWDIIFLQHLRFVAVTLQEREMHGESERWNDRLRPDQGGATAIEHGAIPLYRGGTQVGPAGVGPRDINRHRLVLLVIEG